MTPEDPWQRVTVVLVTYNSAAIIAECLGRLIEARHVVVIDNGSDDDSLAIVRRLRPMATIIANGENRGYPAAANQAMSCVTSEYGLLLNIDAAIDGDRVARLVAAADAEARAAIVSPVLINDQGRIAFDVMGPGQRQHHRLDAMPSGDFCTWFVTCAVALVRMTAWRAIGGNDEAFFLYSDDVDLCLRLTRAGYSILVRADVIATHLGGRSTRIDWRLRWLKDRHMTWSRFYLESKYGDPEAARRAAARAAGRFLLRTLLYLLLLRPDRVRGNLAKAVGAWTFRRGHSAR